MGWGVQKTVADAIREAFGGDEPSADMLAAIDDADKNTMMTRGQDVGGTTITLAHTTLLQAVFRRAADWRAAQADLRPNASTPQRRGQSVPGVTIVVGKEAIENPGQFADMLQMVRNLQQPEVSAASITQRAADAGLKGLSEFAPPAQYVKELQDKVDAGRNRNSTFFPGQSFPKSLYPHWFDESKKTTLADAGMFGGFPAFLHIHKKWGVALMITDAPSGHPYFGPGDYWVYQDLLLSIASTEGTNTAIFYDELERKSWEQRLGVGEHVSLPDEMRRLDRDILARASKKAAEHEKKPGAKAAAVPSGEVGASREPGAGAVDRRADCYT